MRGRQDGCGYLPQRKYAPLRPSATNETVRDPAFIIYNGSISLSGYKIFGYPTRYQANVQNLTNKVYHDGVEGFFGFPRKFLFSTDTKF